MRMTSPPHFGGSLLVIMLYVADAEQCNEDSRVGSNGMTFTLRLNQNMQVRLEWQ